MITLIPISSWNTVQEIIFIKEFKNNDNFPRLKLYLFSLMSLSLSLIYIAMVSFIGISNHKI